MMEILKPVVYKRRKDSNMIYLVLCMFVFDNFISIRAGIVTIEYLSAYIVIELISELKRLGTNAVCVFNYMRIQYHVFAHLFAQ